MPKPKAAYVAALLSNSRRFRELDKATVREMLSILRMARSDIAARLAAGGTQFQAYALRSLISNIEQEIQQLETAWKTLATQATINAYELGVRSVADPIKAAGFQINYYRPSTSQINLLTDWSADLIKQVSNETIGKISTALRSGVLGGRSPLDMMEQINRILGMDARGNLYGGKRMLTGGVSVRAERIFRTETMRVFNLASHAQQQAIRDQIPGTLKRWMATGDSRTRDTHLQAHNRYYNNPIPVDEPFIVGNDELMYPLDPAGSPEETINCRCRDITIHPEIGVIGTPMDSAVSREVGRRENERE